jgi:hypothetical protein
MKTLLIALLAVSLLGPISSQPSDPAPQAPAARTAPPPDAMLLSLRARKATLDQLEVATAQAQFTLSVLRDLDAPTLTAVRAAVQSMARQSDYIAANAEVWATLRASIGALMMLSSAHETQRENALALGGTELVSLVYGQERIVDDLSTLFDLRWDILIALELVEDSTTADIDHGEFDIAGVTSRVAGIPIQAKLATYSEVLDYSAIGDWQANGAWMVIPNVLTDLSVDAGRIVQFSREAAQDRSGAARLLWNRSRRIDAMTMPLKKLIWAYMPGC